MTTAGGDELTVRAAIRDELTGPLEGIRRELARVGGEADRAGKRANLGARGFDKMAAGAGRLAKMAGKAAVYGVGGLTAALGVATTAVVTFGAKAAIQLQTATTNLTTLTGSAKTAGRMVKQLNDYGNATTFDTGPLAEAAQQMLTYGIAAKDVVPDMKMLGDIAMGNQEKLSGLAYVFAQVQGNGHLMGQDLLQMINQGFNPLNEISKRTGKSMGELRAEMSKGQISFAMVQQAMEDATAKGGRFYHGAVNGSKTVAGAWGNMTGSISSGLAIAMRPLLPIAQRLMGRISDLAMSQMPALRKGIRGVIVEGRRLQGAFDVAGLDGVAAVITRDFGVDATGALEQARSIVADLGKVLNGVLIPAVQDAANVLPSWTTPLGLARDLLGFMADHTTTAKVAIEALVVTLTAAKAATVAMTIATKAKAAADAISLLRLKMLTPGTMEYAVASKVAAAGQWLLNAAMEANPIGLVIAVLVALGVAMVVLWKKSETFRKIVTGAFNAIADAGRWLYNHALGPVFSLIVKGLAWVMDKYGDMLDGLSHVPGFGWAKTAADAMHGAADKAREMADAIKHIPDRQVHVGLIPPSAAEVAKVDRMLNRAGGPVGDTASSRAHGSGLGIANTYAAHSAAMAATGTRPTITNVGIGGGGKGRGSGDHQAGRALDLVGPGLDRYGRYMRAIGGFAEFHGSGASRHLHTVPPPMGDTTTSRARPRATTGDRRIVVEAGAVRVEVTNPAATVDVEQAVADALDKVLRDREERS